MFVLALYFFFFKQKTAYEMRISDWSSDVCSSDLVVVGVGGLGQAQVADQGQAVARLDLLWPHRHQRLAVQHRARGEQPGQFAAEIGRASCRERVCQYV